MAMVNPNFFPHGVLFCSIPFLMLLLSPFCKLWAKSLARRFFRAFAKSFFAPSSFLAPRCVLPSSVLRSFPPTRAGQLFPHFLPLRSQCAAPKRTLVPLRFLSFSAALSPLSKRVSVFTPSLSFFPTQSSSGDFFSPLSLTVFFPSRVYRHYNQFSFPSF